MTPNSDFSPNRSPKLKIKTKILNDDLKIAPKKVEREKIIPIPFKSLTIYSPTVCSKSKNPTKEIENIINEVPEL
jgi:hypothetical protein